METYLNFSRKMINDTKSCQGDFSKAHFNTIRLILQETTEFLKSALVSNSTEFFRFGVVFFPLILVWYYLFWKPFDYFRDFTDLGFNEAKRKGHGNDTSRRNIINEMRNRRKVGNIPPIYPNGWFIVLESRDLLTETTRELSCLGLTLVAWRGTSGKSYVADAYCPHLGAHLGVNGEVRGDCIKCPFHGWAFDGGENGKCVDIPYSDSVPGFAKIKIWTTVEMNGFIYLWYHAEGEKPHWQPDEIPEISSGKFVYRGRSEFLAACHIQDVAENGSDVNHLVEVHSDAIMLGGEPSNAKLRWKFMSHILTGNWMANPDPKLSHTALLTLKHVIRLFNSVSLMELNVEANQLGPGTVCLRFKGWGWEGVLFFMVTPLEPLLIKITKTFYSTRSMTHPFALFFLLGEAIQLERDIAIWNRKTYVSRPLLTKEDKGVASFRRWFSQFYSENSPKLQDKSNHSIIGRKPVKGCGTSEINDIEFF